MNQLSIFSAIPKTVEELHREVFKVHAQRRAQAERAAQRRIELVDQWGGLWGARFIDGKAIVGPGTWVYLPGGAPLLVARVQAQPGLADRAMLTCIPKSQSVESLLLLSDLTDDFVTRSKPQVLMPTVLFSDRDCAIAAKKQATKAKGKPKPWTDREIRALVQDYFAKEYQGVAHQLIAVAQGYRDSGLDRKQINSFATELQMKLMISGRPFDPDDFTMAYFQVVDEIALLPTMSTQFTFSR
jgi:hypothetical protein